MGAVLSHLQEDNGLVEERPIAYASKKFDARKQNIALDVGNG